MDLRNPIEIYLEELEAVSRRLAVLSSKTSPPSIQVAALIKEAQAQLGLLERSMRDHPALITAQIGVLEAAVLVNSQSNEALHTANFNLHLFLESMGR